MRAPSVRVVFDPMFKQMLVARKTLPAFLRAIRSIRLRANAFGALDASQEFLGTCRYHVISCGYKEGEHPYRCMTEHRCGSRADFGSGPGVSHPGAARDAGRPNGGLPLRVVRAVSFARARSSPRFSVRSASVLFLPLISWALLQANSCVRQLRGFCFPGSALTPSGSLP